MAKNSLVVSVLLVLAGACLAQEEQRMDVKGMKLGNSLAEMQATAKLKCGPDPARIFDTQCRYASPKDQTFAGQRAASVVFSMLDGRLDTVEFQLAGGVYDQVRSALDDKFGAVSPDGTLNELRSYMMNGDRAHLMYVDGHRTLVLFEAAAGAAERERRLAAAKAAVRKDM